MNYIEVVKAVWMWYLSSSLEPNDYCLMMRLVAISNDDMRWGACFLRNNQELCGYTKLSYKQLTNSRNKLEQLGLISFEQRNGVTNCKYQINYETLLDLSKIGKGLAKVTQRFGKGDGIVKINKTKQNKTLPLLPPEEIFIEPENEEEEKPPIPPHPPNNMGGYEPNPVWDLSKSNLYRQPKIPKLEKVIEVFRSANGTDEMATAFFNRHEKTGWYYKNEPIVKFENFVNTFIANWAEIEKKKANGTGINQTGNGKRNDKNGGFGIIASNLKTDFEDIAARGSAGFGNEI